MRISIATILMKHIYYQNQNLIKSRYFTDQSRLFTNYKQKTILLLMQQEWNQFFALQQSTVWNKHFAGQKHGNALSDKTFLISFIYYPILKTKVVMDLS